MKTVVYTRIYWNLKTNGCISICVQKRNTTTFLIQCSLLFFFSFCDYRFNLASSMDQSPSWAARSRSPSQEITWTLFAVYLMMQDYIALNDLMRVDNVLERMWKEAVVAWFFKEFSCDSDYRTLKPLDVISHPTTLFHFNIILLFIAMFSFSSSLPIKTLYAFLI